ncbi:general secretion pathway protein G [Lebetimonas natsushimae]|uniref:General secretion pathway protein G n=1 Tax=Lebetimonas natsushimae TaxID=1936991 RepID=A0A292YDC7_9BACT|nr:type II secretion system protein [Lebetimonas natsushimae]GAX87401.1 general secretion pathway protein G [Lebetimonas natsushimae]
MKKSFTLLELVFVIVVIGILAGVALPRLFTGVDDAVKAKVKTEVSTINAAIASKYTKNILSNNNSCPKLEGNPDKPNYFFEGVLSQPIPKNDNMLKWDGNGTDYNVTYQGKIIYFNYIQDQDDKGCIFECNTTKSTSKDFNCSIFK